MYRQPPEPQEATSIQDLASRYTFKKSNKVVRSAHNACINAVLEFMEENDDRYGYWCGRLKRAKISPSEVYGLIKKCKAEGKPPQKLFNYLLKEKCIKEK